jgi:hypothetical protein
MPSNDEPPSYFPDLISVLSDVPIIRNEAPSFFIDQDRVVSAAPPNQPIYRLSEDILSGKATDITVKKLTYYVKDSEPPEYHELEDPQHLGDKKEPVDRPRSGGLNLGPGTTSQPSNPSFTTKSMLDIPPSPPQDGPTIASRRTEIYNIKPSWFKEIGDGILISSSRKSCFPSTFMYIPPSSSVWKICRVKHVKEAYGTDRQIMEEDWKIEKMDAGWVWRNKSGKQLGTEGGMRLDVSKDVEEKDVDFLVAAWIAKVAFEAGKGELKPHKTVKEPMGWSKCMFLDLNSAVNIY